MSWGKKVAPAEFMCATRTTQNQSNPIFVNRTISIAVIVFRLTAEQIQQFYGRMTYEL